MISPVHLPGLLVAQHRCILCGEESGMAMQNGGGVAAQVDVTALPEAVPAVQAALEQAIASGAFASALQAAGAHCRQP